MDAAQKAQKEYNKIREVILKSGLFDEDYYRRRFDTPPEGDLLDYFIKNGLNEERPVSIFFDTGYYLSENPDVKEAGMNPLYHYIMHGKKEGRSPKPAEEESLYMRWCVNRQGEKGFGKKLRNFRDMLIILKSGMFNGAWYLEQNPDVAEKITAKKQWDWRFSKNPFKRSLGRLMTTPVAHYVKHGMFEYRDPSPEFSTAYYMNSNPDLIHGRHLTPFVHYIKHGKPEGRSGKRGLDGYSGFNVMYESKTRDDLLKTDLLLSIVGEDGFGCGYEKTETLSPANGFKAAAKAAKGAAVWMPDNDDLPDANFVKKAMRFMSDESVFAVVRNAWTDDTDRETDILSYLNFGIKSGVIQGRVFSAGDIIFRAPEGTKAFEKLAGSPTNEEITLFLLEFIKGGKAVIINDKSASPKYAPDKKAYTEKLKDVLLCGYTNENSFKKQYFNAFENAYRGLDMSYAEIRKKLDPDKYQKGKMNIAVGIYAFTFGGGEIMPIRLANRLYNMGHNVTVHIYCDDEIDTKVRKMLMPDIPVFYSGDKGETAVHLRELGIQVYSTHHQAIQQNAAFMADEYPDIMEKILNVATSHGMYENLEDDAKNYLFEETNLIANTDYWTYVADKNLIPFKEHNCYNKECFVKIPNGMERPVTNPVDLSKLGIKKDAFIICVVSRALKEKGWLNAINAVTAAREKTGRDIQLLLVGAGEVYDEYADKLGNDFIHFLGFRQNPCDFLAASDLCMLPSYYPSESAPLCLIEAMMCGKPSIASDIGDIKDMLTCDGETAGEVFALEDMQVNDAVLTDRIVRLVTDEALYKKACETAVKKSDVFDIDNVLKEYLDVYGKYADKLAKNGCENNADLKIKRKLDAYAKFEASGGLPKVSVIVPNYNHSAFLKTRLDCIYNQTYKNFEVLLLDDCSKDNSREILTEYAEKYPEKTKLMFNEQNSGGVFFQWAKGVKNSTGELCWIAESDDYCDTNFLEELVPAFADEDVKLSYCKYCFTDENDNKNPDGFFYYVGTVDDKKWRSNYVNDSADEVDSALGILNSIPNASGAVFRNPGENDVFFREDWYKMKICGDWIFYLYIIKGGKVAYSVDTTSYFRFHSNNSSAKTYTNSAYYKEHEMVASALRNLYFVDREVIERNHEKIRKFYHEHIDGTDKEFESWYSVERAMQWVWDKASSERVMAKQALKYADKGDTVVIDPIKAATDADDVSYDDKMQFVGLNTGNMLFVSAVKEQTNYKDIIWFNRVNMNKLEREGTVKGIIPSSNFIIADDGDFMVDQMNGVYEGTDCLITMAGLGAQAYAPYNTPKKLVGRLTEKKINFFRMAAERAVSLGVRGEFTAECLEIMGIKNYRIIGCPTCFKYFDGIYKQLKKPSADKTIFTVTGKKPEESAIARFGMDNGSIFLMQMTTEMPQILFGRDISDEEFAHGMPELGKTKEEYVEFVKKNGRIFFDMDKWNDYMQKENFGFSYGSRFHGNMSALRNGIPSLWITHDSRTSELVDTLKLPHISLSEFSEIKNTEQLIERCDYTEFYKAYGELTKEYVKFLDENGISHKFTV